MFFVRLLILVWLVVDSGFLSGRVMMMMIDGVNAVGNVLFCRLSVLIDL